MSRINDLIKELCPNGVEHRKICDICNFQNGFAFKSNLFKTEGEILLRITNIDGKKINLSDVKYIDINDYNTDLKSFRVNEDEIVIAMSGATTGKIGINHTGKILYLNQRVGKLTPKNNEINNHFLYHYLLSKVSYFYQLAGGGAQPNLSSDDIKNTTIPCPPLEVQKEIVRSLDKFGELESKLESELEARKRQYEFIRGNLLKNNEHMVCLKDICTKYSSGITPLKSNNKFYENGTINWLRTGEVKFNEIYDTECFVTEYAMANTALKIIPENCVIVAISGATAGRCAINKIPLTTNQHCLNIEIDSNKALYKYVYYCIESRYKELISKKEGARGDLNSSRIIGLKIPLCSLEEQERIVSILGKFDKLINDMSEGLPAEIELRRQQYEYYRNKLLNFDEI